MGLLRILLIGLMLGAAPGLATAQHGPPAYDSLGADWGAQQDQVRACVAQARCVPAVEVIVKIRRTTPGRPLDVGLEPEGGREVYRIRWAASDGRRIDYIADAKTGAILRAEGR
jgi:uncharacterized membrane protein YkoI